jgi:tetratricopeptide (TPR) repeat protein
LAIFYASFDIEKADLLQNEALTLVLPLRDLFPESFTKVALVSSSRHIALHQYASATELLNQVVTLLESQYSKDSRVTAMELNAAAAQYHAVGNLVESQRLNALASSVFENLPANTPFLSYLYVEDRESLRRGVETELSLSAISKNAESVLSAIEKLYTFARGNYGGFPRELSSTLLTIASFRMYAGLDVASTYELLDEVGDIISVSPEHFPEVQYRLWLLEGALMTRSGAFASAVLRFTAAADLVETVLPTDAPARISASNEIANYLVAVRQYEAAVGLRRKIVEAMNEAGLEERPEYAGALLDLAFVQFLLRDYGAAAALCEKVIAVAPSINFTRALPLPQVPGVSIQESQDRVDEAIENIHRGIYGTDFPMVSLQYRALTLLELIYGAMDEDSKWQEVKTRQYTTLSGKFEEDSDLYLNTVWNAANYYNAKGKRNLAYEQYKRILDIAQDNNIEDHQIAMQSRRELLWLEAELGNWAIAAREMTIYLEEIPVQSNDVALIKAGLARVLLRSMDYEGAAEVLDDLASWQGTMVNYLRTTLTDASINIDEREVRGSVYSNLTSVFLEAARSDKLRDDLKHVYFKQAFTSVQLLRANDDDHMAVARMIARDAISSGVTRAKFERYQDLLFELKSLERWSSQSLGGGTAGEPSEFSPQAQLADITAELRTLWSELEADDDIGRAIGENTPIDLSSVQTLLSDDEALVVFHVNRAFPMANELGAAFVVLKYNYFQVPLCRDHECGDLQTFIKAIKKFKSHVEPQASYTVRTRLEERNFHRVAGPLYEALWAEIDEKISSAKGIDKVIIVPDIELVGFPFSALPTGKVAASDSGGWLAQKYILSYLPSLRLASSFGDSQVPRGDYPTFVGFGDPSFEGESAPTGGEVLAVIDGGKISVSEKFVRLEDSATEICRLALSYSASENVIERPLANGVGYADPCQTFQAGSYKDASVFLGSDATEANLRTLSSNQSLRNAQIVAFATHSIADGSGGQDPGLLLTPSNGDDGFLSATEITKLRMNPDLLLLSACSTVKGDTGESGARELPTLVTAFYHAGARNILATHLDVRSSASSQISQAVAARIKDGEQPSVALSAVIRLSIEDGAPVEYWAPFAFYGWR